MSPLLLVLHTLFVHLTKSDTSEHTLYFISLHNSCLPPFYADRNIKVHRVSNVLLASVQSVQSSKTDDDFEDGILRLHNVVLRIGIDRYPKLKDCD